MPASSASDLCAGRLPGRFLCLETVYDGQCGTRPAFSSTHNDEFWERGRRQQLGAEGHFDGWDYRHYGLFRGMERSGICAQRDHFSGYSASRTERSLQRYFRSAGRRKCTGQRSIRQRRDQLSSHRNFDRNRNTATTVSAQRCTFLESEQLASDGLQRLPPRIGRLLREDQSIAKRDDQLYRQLCPEWNDLRLRNHSD